MRAELALVLVTLVACGPARVLTRPEGDGGWSAERRQDEIAARATPARVDLDGGTPPVADASTPLGLEDVVRLAATESRRLAEADEDVAIAAARVGEARGLLFPSLSAQGRYTWNSAAQTTNVHLPASILSAFGGTPPVVRIRDQQYGTVNGTATVPIDVFGEITKGLTAAQAGYRGEQAQRYATLLSEQVVAIRSYFDVLQADRLHAVTEQTLAAQRQQLANAESRVNAGRLTKNELLVVQVAVRNSEQLLLQIELDRDRARWALNQVIGRPVDAPTTLRDVVERPTVPAAADSLREAYAHNPVLLSLVEEQQRLEDTASALARSRFPQLQGGGAIDHSTSDIVEPQTIGSGFVGFTWAYDLGGRKESEIAQARIAAEQNRTRIEGRLRNVEATVRAAQQAVEERVAAYESARTAVLQAEENLRIRQQQFDVGRATSEDLLDATALLARERAALAAALYEAHTRRAELQELMGLPLDAVVLGQR